MSTISSTNSNASIAKKGEAAKIVAEMKEQGIIERLCSPWVSAVALVKKKTEAPDFVWIIGNWSPSPRTSHRHLTALVPKIKFLFRPKSKKWVLADGDGTVWQGEHGVSTGEGVWQFKVMSFGLTNAHALLNGWWSKFCLGSVNYMFGVSGLHHRPCQFIWRKITSIDRSVQSVEKCKFKAQP